MFPAGPILLHFPVTGLRGNGRVSTGAQAESEQYVAQDGLELTALLLPQLPKRQHHVYPFRQMAASVWLFWFLYLFSEVGVPGWLHTSDVPISTAGVARITGLHHSWPPECW